MVHFGQVLLVITLQTQGTHTVKTLVGFEGTLGYPRIVTITLNSFKINIKINKYYFFLSNVVMHFLMI